jgi:hypothetical protein
LNRNSIPHPTAPQHFPHKTFAVLEERRLREKTLLIVKWCFKQPEPERVLDGSDPMEWKTLSVPFFAAADTACSIDSAALLSMDDPELEPGRRRTEDDVFVVHGMEEEYAKHGGSIKAE